MPKLKIVFTLYLQSFVDFAENLAYEVDDNFGREFKSWLQVEGSNRGPKATVRFF